LHWAWVVGAKAHGCRTDRFSVSVLEAAAKSFTKYL
jgi:hypothetical protein